MDIYRSIDSLLEPIDPEDENGLFALWSAGSLELRKELLTVVRMFIEEELKITLGYSQYFLTIEGYEALSPITLPRPPLERVEEFGYIKTGFNDLTPIPIEEFIDHIFVLNNKLKIINPNAQYANYFITYWSGKMDPIADTSPEYLAVLLGCIENFVRNNGNTITKGVKGGMKVDKGVREYIRNTFGHMYKWTV